MKLDYREYYYNGEYDEKSVNIPDGSRIFDLELSFKMCRIKDIDGEVYSRNYIILCDTIEDYEDSELYKEFFNYYIFGNKMIILIKSAYIKESENLKDFPNEIFKGYVFKFPTPVYNSRLSLEEATNIIKTTPYYCICKIKKVFFEGFIVDRIFLVDTFNFKKLVSIDEDFEMNFSFSGLENIKPEPDITAFNNILTKIYNRMLE